MIYAHSSAVDWRSCGHPMKPPLLALPPRAGVNVKPSVLRNLDAAGRGRALGRAGSEEMTELPY